MSPSAPRVTCVPVEASSSSVARRSGTAEGSSGRIVVRGAREHNLKNAGIDIPRDSLVVFTGLSGSGKSSLAFDTIFAEGQRRYVESLSSYARMFLGQMDKPDVDMIEGLSPAVSIDQKGTNRNPRSTVGTITEVHDHLRLLFSRAGRAHCPVCGEAITRQTPQQIVDQLMELPERTRFQVLAPVVRGRKGEHIELLKDLQQQGYSRALIDGQRYELTDPPALEKQKKHTIEVIIDRLVAKGPGQDTNRQRLTDSVETALRLAAGIMLIDFVDVTDNSDSDLPARRRFSENLACPNEHEINVEAFEPRTFSFNSPFGACPTCTGIGTEKEVDPELIVPDEELSIREGAIQPWSQAGKLADYYEKVVSALAQELHFTLDQPWRSLSSEAKEALLHGKNYKVHVKYRNRWGRERAYTTGFEGAIATVNRRYKETESESSRERYEGYMREIPCPSCHGARLKPEVLAVTIGGRNIAEVSDLAIQECLDFLSSVEFTDREKQVADAVMREVGARLGFLLDVGLDYLSLSRPASTLSGGEAQRIRLATQIGSGLVGVLYVLDEPSIGLHQRDNDRLIGTLKRLRDLGNTLIVVEHDEDTIDSADWLVDIGPGAGENGGEVVYSGPVEGIKTVDRSVTGAYLSGRKEISVPATRRGIDKNRTLRVLGAKQNNLKNIDVTVPLGCFVAVTGVSGSGKSTLVNDILYNVLANRLNRARHVPGRHRQVQGTEQLDKVVHVDQSPIGRTPRSNPATYTGVFDKIRKLFAETNEAKMRGYTAGRFSFNVKGGRCEACHGDGTLKIEMNFLPDVYVPCEVCHGARYNRETLEVKFKGKSIAEVLDMPIAEAAEFFGAMTGIVRYLETLTQVGLGYVRLGQPATTLSGGEAQRVKLATELQRRSTGKTIYVLDEPTTGLHFEDVRKLLLVLQGLVDKSNTVVVIEHNLDVIKSADWIIDMGPEGGAGGGTVVAEGTPEDIARTEGSHTGTYLAPLLERSGVTPTIVKPSTASGKTATASTAAKSSTKKTSAAKKTTTGKNAKTTAKSSGVSASTRRKAKALKS
ncbi:excinuclease ABC subunit UvrA [Dermatophilus congolensis]|nr:excinuclease ABC subunit UvrA [Dermatophilus congolensis]MBO3142922.1 excinuclease ABC subunit UvrA [Dermatophilus congolensis]